MPVLESRDGLGWLGVDGNVKGHPGYVAILPGVPTVVTETDWEIGRRLDEVKRRLNTGALRISSKLTAAVALALVPSAEILRLADAEVAKPPVEAEPVAVALPEPVFSPEPEPGEPVLAEALPVEVHELAVPEPIIDAPAEVEPDPMTDAPVLADAEVAKPPAEAEPVAESKPAPKRRARG